MSSRSSLEPVSGPAPKHLRYGWLTRRVDRFHGWLDGLQQRPDIRADDVRTAYWHRLVQWAHRLYIKEQLRFLEQHGQAMIDYQADRKQLALLAEEIERRERALALARDELARERLRLEKLRPADAMDDFESQRKFKLLLFDHEKAVRLAQQALAQARSEHGALESKVERLEGGIKLGEAQGRTRSHQAWGLAVERFTVYRQSLVRSHPRGLALEKRLNELSTEPPPFNNGAGPGTK